MDLDRKYRWFRVRLLAPNREFKYYIFRGFTAGEKEIAATRSTQFGAEEYLLSVCVKDIDLENEWAGTCQTLIGHIINLSGYDDEGRTIKEAREWMESPEGRYEAVAVSLIPGCTPFVLRTCDPADRAKYILVGKFMFESIYGKSVDSLFGPEEDVSYFDNVPPPQLDPGQRASYTESGFSWKASK